MRALIQRVKKAKVIFEREEKSINQGMVIFLGIEENDREEDSQYLVNKILSLRIFEANSSVNKEKEFEKSIIDISGEILVVSQFTLYADCRKGRRPDFSQAAPMEKAKFLYEYFIQKLREKYDKIETGKFGAKMLVEIHNDGPVTIILDTEKLIG